MEVKLGVLRFICLPNFLTEDQILPHLLIASSDSHHEIAAFAETELHRRLNSSSLEAPITVASLFRLVIGDSSKVIRLPSIVFVSVKWA